tara:strand:+ start:4744 stop:5190 length:447 start_codon:yes stop_codon:yes gene_type:complete
MAVFDRSKKPFIIDRDENIFIGLTLPLARSEGNDGWFLSTKTVIEAVKVNIRNLVKTQKRERLYRPELGLNLRKFQFEPITESLKMEIENEIRNTFRRYLRFVKIESLIINFAQDPEASIDKNTLTIGVRFRIIKDPNTLHTVAMDLF